MAVSLNALRDRIRQRAADVAVAAASTVVDDLYAAAGSGLPSGSILQTVAEAPTQVSVHLSVPDDVAGGQTVWRWVVGEPTFPFDPHQRLADATFTEADWQDVLYNPAGWPSVAYYYPGDHDGCQCRVENVVGDLVFDPETLLRSEPLIVSAFGAQILVTPAAPTRTGEAPPWWTDTLTQARWSAAVRDALDSTPSR